MNPTYNASDIEAADWLRTQGFVLDAADGVSFSRVVYKAGKPHAQTIAAVTRGLGQQRYWTAAMVDGVGTLTYAVRFADQQPSPVAAFVLAETRQWQI